MSELSFISEYQCDPPQDDSRLWTISHLYLDRTEAHDKMVCSCERNGVATPANASEYAAVQCNAHDLMRICIAQAEAVGYTKMELKRVIQGLRLWRERTRKRLLKERMVQK